MKVTKTIERKAILTFIMYELRTRTDTHSVLIEANFARRNADNTIYMKEFQVYVTDRLSFECECIKVQRFKDALALCRILGVM